MREDTWQNQSSNRITSVLIAGLLFLRLFLAGARCIPKTSSDWLMAPFTILTYLLTAALIWWERSHLADYHIGVLALTIIILFKPIQTLILAKWGIDGSGLAFPKLPALALWAIAIGLLAAMLSTRPKLAKIRFSSLVWFVGGTLIGVAKAIPDGYLCSLQITEDIPWERAPELGRVVISSFQAYLYQLGYAAVTEEPLFRGFLWGYLRQLQWKEWWVWLFQATLFSLSHIYYVGKFPFSFWIIIPSDALIMGLLAWRSRSIATSMAAHAAGNTLNSTIGSLIAFHQLGN